MVYSSEWEENIYTSATEALIEERKKDRTRALPTISKRLEVIKNPPNRILSQVELDEIAELEKQLYQIKQEIELAQKGQQEPLER